MAITTDFRVETENHYMSVTNDLIWIQNKEGEGMEITHKQLDEILADAMDKYF